MHATVHTTGSADAVRAAWPAGVRPAGTIEIAHLDDAQHTLVALWPEESLVPAGERAYRVADRVDGRAAGRTPLFAQITWLNGTGDPAVAAAAERGGQERIRPAIRDVDGLVGVLVLRSTDDRIVVVGTAVGLESLHEVRERISRTELLPGEDPALLPGPDRMELGRVLRAEIPAVATS